MGRSGLAALGGWRFLKLDFADECAPAAASAGSGPLDFSAHIPWQPFSEAAVLAQAGKPGGKRRIKAEQQSGSCFKVGRRNRGPGYRRTPGAATTAPACALLGPGPVGSSPARRATALLNCRSSRSVGPRAL